MLTYQLYSSSFLLERTHHLIAPVAHETSSTLSFDIFLCSMLPSAHVLFSTISSFLAKRNVQKWLYAELRIAVGRIATLGSTLCMLSLSLSRILSRGYSNSLSSLFDLHQTFCDDYKLTALPRPLLERQRHDLGRWGGLSPSTLSQSTSQKSTRRQMRVSKLLNGKLTTTTVARLCSSHIV